MTVPAVGDEFTHRRTFTPETVDSFGHLTGDRQPIHTEPDENGRLVVHGLLTGSLSTKIGADIELVARRMTFEFRTPVYTGQEITCRWTVTDRTENADRYVLENEVTFHDEQGTLVADGTVEGVVWKPDDR